MLSHYIKISFRELLKYRTQSLVSIIGLTVGFTAFILGSYWLWWETHFDNFHPEADRLYCLVVSSCFRDYQRNRPAFYLPPGKKGSNYQPGRSH